MFLSSSPQEQKNGRFWLLSKAQPLSYDELEVGHM
jgi:hypothetical protein